jgi:hypothetical protein
MHSTVTPLREDTVYGIFKQKDVETEKGGKQLEKKCTKRQDWIMPEMENRDSLVTDKWNVIVSFHMSP